MLVSRNEIQIAIKNIKYRFILSLRITISWRKTKSNWRTLKSLQGCEGTLNCTTAWLSDQTTGGQEWQQENASKQIRNNTRLCPPSLSSSNCSHPHGGLLTISKYVCQFHIITQTDSVCFNPLVYFYFLIYYTCCHGQNWATHKWKLRHHSPSVYRTITILLLLRTARLHVN